MRTLEDRCDPLLEEFLTPAEAAKVLRISSRTLARWREDNQGPAYSKLGRRILYRRDAVQQWVNTRRSW